MSFDILVGCLFCVCSLVCVGLSCVSLSSILLSKVPMMLLLYVLLSCVLVMVVLCNCWLCFESTCCLVGCFMFSDVSELNTSVVGLLLFMSGRRWRSAILLHESGAACWFDIFVVVL